MSDLKEALVERFGAHRVNDIPVAEGEMPLLALDLEIRSQVTIVMTNGLSNYTMPVPEKLSGYEHNEICFCLPSYWEWQDLEDPRMNWIFPWIQKLASYVVKNETWFGHGHTFSNYIKKTTAIGTDEIIDDIKSEISQALSPTMKQNHLMLSSPILMENELKEFIIDGKRISFLTIIPLFQDEFDYKQSKGTFKTLKKLRAKGVDELLDDYRTTSLRGKWRIF